MTETGDCREIMRAWAYCGLRAQMCVTSPPYYGLRSYLPDDHPDKRLEIGTEKTPEEYIANLVDVFRAVRDMLTDDGTLWVNLGDSYATRSNGTKSTSTERLHGERAEKYKAAHANRSTGLPPGLKHKDLIGTPWMLAFALRADGWFLRQEIIWSKSNPMPESVTDRCTKAHEHIFLLSKRQQYLFDHEAIKEPATASTAARLAQTGLADQKGSQKQPNRGGRAMKAVGDGETRNKRSVWTTATARYADAHFATFPPELIEPCILAGSRPGDVVLDPFLGSGTTAATATRLGRDYLGCDINSTYEPMQQKRINP